MFSLYTSRYDRRMAKVCASALLIAWKSASMAIGIGPTWYHWKTRRISSGTGELDCSPATWLATSTT